MTTVTCVDCGTTRILTGHGHRDLCRPCSAARDGKQRRAKTPGAWAEDGLCAQTDPEAFFPQRGGSPARAKRICRACPVADQCLEWALQTDQEYGIYGGMTRDERLRSVGRRAAA